MEIHSCTNENTVIYDFRALDVDILTIGCNKENVKK
jgi:hypothetical protein